LSQTSAEWPRVHGRWEWAELTLVGPDG